MSTKKQIQFLSITFITGALLFFPKEASAVSQRCGFTAMASQPVLKHQAYATGSAQIRSDLREIKNTLGLKVVAEVFEGATAQTDWEAFLDIAASEGMQVYAAFLDDPPVWNGTNFTLGINETFLRAMRGHAGLFAFQIIDEPFHEKHNFDITTARLQQLYSQVKSIAPDVKIGVAYSREIQNGETNPGLSNFKFADDQCDICIISALEFRNFGTGNFFDEQTMIDNHTTSRSVIRERNPSATMLSSLQVFGSATGASTYYMPGPGELQDMIDTMFSTSLENEGKLDGLTFQGWKAFDADDSGQDNLSKSKFVSQRNILRDMLRGMNVNCLKGDVNGDNKVDGTDYNQVIADFGRTDTTSSDINGNKKVDIFDLNTVVQNKNN